MTRWTWRASRRDLGLREAAQTVPFPVIRAVRDPKWRTRMNGTESGIAMLGATESGKSTFLCALQIALLKQDEEWVIFTRTRPRSGNWSR